MTTPEIPTPEGENEPYPLQVARGAFTSALFAENTQGLIGGVNGLELALLKSGEDPREFIQN